TEAVAEEQAPQQLEEPQPQAPQPEPEAPQPEQEAPQPPEGEPEPPLEPDQDQEPDSSSEPEPAEEFDVVVLAPGLVEAVPADGAIGVNPGASLKLTFSQAMDTASVEAAFSVEPGVSGSFAWDPDGTAMTFTPDDDFVYGTVVQW